MDTGSATDYISTQFIAPKLEKLYDDDQSLTTANSQASRLNLSHQQCDELFLTSIRLDDYVELPCNIFVETRFITKQSAGELVSAATNIETAEHIFESEAAVSLPPATSCVLKTVPKPKPERKTYANAAVIATVVQKECGTNTESENPTCDRAIQTNEENEGTKTIGIQCCFEDDLDFEDNTELSDKDNGKEEFKFTFFICENSVVHLNGKVECVICGDVQSDMSAMESHLALHWGPVALCSHCGIQLEHKSLLRRHACRAKDRSVTQLLRCPHFDCSAEAISTLEMLDHINEHCGERSYKCKHCQNVYFTMAELQQHLKLKCQKSITRSITRQKIPYKNTLLPSALDRSYRLRVTLVHALNGAKGLRSSPLNKSRVYKGIQRCQLCMKVCHNEFIFKRHSKRCMRSYRYRYKKKCESENTKVLTILKECNGTI